MKKSRNGYLENRTLLILRIVITLLAFIVMVAYAGHLSLWYDDLGTIHIVEPGQNLKTLIERYRIDSGTNAPLFFIPAYLWIRIVPYGTVWLKMLNILFSTMGVWFCGVGAQKLRGDRAAVLSTAFAATSTFLVTHAALTFRCYGLVFFLCSLLIPIYHEWLTNRDKVSSAVKFCIIITAMLYTHFFATMSVGVIAAYDLWLLFRKKARWKILIPYTVSALVFFPYFCSVLGRIQKNFQGFWGGVPSLTDLLNIFDTIFCNSKFILFLFCFGIVLLCYGRYAKQAQNDVRDFSPSHYTMWLLAIWILFVLIFVYIYCRYIHPQASVFVARYFIVCVAPAMVFCGVSADWLLTVLCDGKSHSSVILLEIAAITSVYMAGLTVELRSLESFPGSANEPFEQSIDWIYEHPDALNESTLVCYPAYQIQGGVTYYATHNGQRQNLNFGYLSEENWMTISTVYVTAMHGGFSEEMQNILNENFTEIERNDALNTVVYAQKPIESAIEENTNE